MSKQSVIQHLRMKLMEEGYPSQIDKDGDLIVTVDGVFLSKPASRPAAPVRAM